MENMEGMLKLSLAGYQEEIAAAEMQFDQQRILERIWNRDFRVWSENPAEITNRLGWLDSPDASAALAGEIIDFVSAVRRDGFTNALLLGMGGSSLAAEVFSLAFGVKKGYLDLAVLDSTHPGAVLEHAQKLDPAKTLYIVSTKSGGTVETFSFMKFFYNQTLAKVGKGKAGKHFIAITDPGSGLESAARELKFRRIFLNDADVGGRYAALSLFGIVPAALLGIDVKELLQRAALMSRSCLPGNGLALDKNAAARLGVCMGLLADAGKDKITFITSAQLSPFADWLEQLIAESSGKTGKGILPVTGEAVLPPAGYAADRFFVYLHLQDDHAQDAAVSKLRAAGNPVAEIQFRDVYDIGGEFFRWEMATAIACWRMGIQPFNQPDVESAKALTRELLAKYAKEGRRMQPAAQYELPGIKVYASDHAVDINEVFPGFLGKNTLDFKSKGAEYISIQAYVQPDKNSRRLLQQIRAMLRLKYQTAVTVGYGPRFLHSTGQLHKGDAGKGLFVQILSLSEKDAPIPDHACSEESGISFGTLIAAQAFGDRQALLEKGRRVITFQFTNGQKAGFAHLLQLLAGNR
jgi:glucose-6-phosphate isomerase